VRIVLDTNVVVSALLWGGTPFRLIQSATDGIVTLYTSPELLAELRGVLGHAHLALRLQRQNASVEEAMTLYGALAINVSPTVLPRVVAADADDDHVVAAAIAAKADLIVSGDRHLLDIGSHRGIRIITPTMAVDLVGAR
jgi:hypothetical protein